MSSFFEFMKNSLKQEMLWSKDGELTRDGQGEPVELGAFPCRWESAQLLVTNTLGESLTSQARVFTQAAIDVDGQEHQRRVTPDDQLTSPYGLTAKVISVTHEHDFDGKYTHSEVML